MYDDIREYEVGKTLPAIPNSRWKASGLETYIGEIVQRVEVEGINRLIDRLIRRMTYEIKKASGESIAYNASLDPIKPKYARVPTGPETCEWCIMLASRGYVYVSAQSAGALTHWHENCDCVIVPQFDANYQVKGYDPKKYEAIWDANVVYDEYGHVDTDASLKNIRAWTGRDEGYYEAHKQERHEYYEQVKKNGLLGTSKKGTSPRNSQSKYKFEGGDGLPAFSDFNDVKSYLYGADSQEALQQRYSILGRIFGTDSEQMRSSALRNVMTTAGHKFE